MDSSNPGFRTSGGSASNAYTGGCPGAGVAAAASKILRKALYGISNLDPLSYAGAVAVLMLIVAIAALLPARRALRLDLAKILHYE